MAQGADERYSGNLNIYIVEQSLKMPEELKMNIGTIQTIVMACIALLATLIL